MRVEVGVKFKVSGSDAGTNTVNNTIASVDMISSNSTHITFSTLGQSNRFVWDVDRHQMLCPEVEDCSVNQTAVDRHLLFGFPFLRSWVSNDTYINFNQSVGIVVNASNIFPVIIEVSKPSATENYTTSWNGTHHTYNLTKAELGDGLFNASVINVSRMYYGGESNVTDISFSYGTTDPITSSDSPDPITSAEGQVFTIWTNYTDTEGTPLSGSTCAVSVFGASYTMAYEPSMRYAIGISAEGRTDYIYTYNVTCTNTSYAPQNVLGSIEVRSGTSGGGGGGGAPPTTTTTTTTLPHRPPENIAELLDWLLEEIDRRADDTQIYSVIDSFELAAASSSESLATFLSLDNPFTRKLFRVYEVGGRFPFRAPLGLVVFAVSLIASFRLFRKGMESKPVKESKSGLVKKASGSKAVALLFSILVSALAVMVLVP